VVEDEEEVRKMAVNVLRRQGYLILEASDEDNALQVCKRRKENVHFLVTDVVMPRIDVPDLAIRLKYSHPHMKILFMSGHTENAISQHGVLNDKVSFLYKPCSAEEFAGKVRELLEG
jgi:two-component system cell cycle sensor histidine kinase/response regulator CckA